MRSSPTASEIREEAYAAMGITAEQVTASPRIEHLFKQIGGKAKVFEYLSGSEEPEARRACELYSILKGKHRKVVPFEAYCVAAKVSVKKMFGIISEEVMDQSSKVSTLLSAAKHPEVVEATIEGALQPHGQVDRKMLHLARGFVPVPKNNVTYVRGNLDQSTHQTANIAVLPPVENTIKILSDRFNVGLPVPPALPPVEDQIYEGDDDDPDEGE